MVYYHRIMLDFIVSNSVVSYRWIFRVLPTASSRPYIFLQGLRSQEARGCYADLYQLSSSGTQLLLCETYNLSNLSSSLAGHNPSYSDFCISVSCICYRWTSTIH